MNDAIGLVFEKIPGFCLPKKFNTDTNYRKKPAIRYSLFAKYVILE